MNSRRSYALAFAALLSGAIANPSPARASVSIAVSWDGLLEESTAAALVTAQEARSVWENGRIVTYSRVLVDRTIAGELAPGSDLWIRTLGGEVATIGQAVEGEAIFAAGQPSLVFLRPGLAGSYEVTARGQGQFFVGAVPGDAAAPTRHVFRSGSLGLLFRPNVGNAPSAQLAGDWLHGRTVEDAVREVATAWGRTHAR